MADYMAGQEPTACLKCGGGVWDNRATKKNPKSPDFKCKNTGCGEGYWQSKKGGNGASTTHVAAAAPMAAAVAVPNRVAVSMGSVPGLDVPAASGVSVAALAAEYAECLDEAIAKVLPRLRTTGVAYTGDTLCAVAATLLIQKKRGG